MSVRIAVVQPIGHAPPNDERNVEEAVRHVERAAEQGAQIVALSETYPGQARAAGQPRPTSVRSRDSPARQATRGDAPRRSASVAKAESGVWSFTWSPRYDAHTDDVINSLPPSHRLLPKHPRARGGT
jgi:predicted amidohydrolase